MSLQFRSRLDPMKVASLSLPIAPPAATPPHFNSSGGEMPLIPSHRRSSRSTCVMAALMAFLIGVGVGITLPMVIAKARPGVVTSRIPNVLEDFAPSQQELKWSRPMHLNLVNGEPSPPPSLDWTSGTWTPPTPTLRDSLSEQSEPTDLSADSTITQNTGDVVDDEVFTSELKDAILIDGIYWGPAVEDALPKGFSNVDVAEWRIFLRKEPVVRLSEGCGRMQNRLLTFANGSHSCCRYRQNFDQIQGEIFSFYLSRLLGINNVPPSALGVVRTNSWQWKGVGGQLALAQWGEERPVVLTKFVSGLGQALIPSPLRAKTRRLHPSNVEDHDSKDLYGLAELAQWSDLIVFDYLTGNLDRVVNNLYNMQWNPQMMEAPAHNLAKESKSGLLVFLDNESGLLHGYRLLDKYEPYHSSLLKALCVFRKGTASIIERLVKKGEAGKLLQNEFKNHEPDLQDLLPTIPDKSVKILNERLRKVHKQIKKCENIYLNS